MGKTSSANPFISICIPTYESNEVLLTSLQQIQRQTFSNFEVIICDDSRSDKVKKIIELFSSDERFHYFRNEVSLGSPENWNKAISLSRGDYIKIMHHDDYFLQLDSLQRMVDLLDNGNYDFVFCGSLAKYTTTGKIRSVYASNFIVSMMRIWPEILFVGNYIGAPSVILFKKTNVIKFDPKTIWLVDLDFYISYLTRNKSLNYTKEPLVCITTDEKTTITSKVKDNKGLKLFEYFYVYNKWRSKNIIIRVFQLRILDNVLSYFKVKSTKEVMECNFRGRIPLISKLRIILNWLSVKTSFLKIVQSGKI